MTARLALLLSLCAAVSSARADGDDGEPWVTGPEAPVVESPVKSEPPLEAGAAREPLSPSPEPTDPWRILPPPPPPPREDLRFSTVLSRTELLRFGDLALQEALVVVPGLHFPRLVAGGELPSLRGHTAAHAQLRVDGVPVAPSSSYPLFPLVGMLDIDGIERVVVRHGPRLEGIGGNSAAAGAIDVVTLPAPVPMGEGLAMAGRLRAAFGGPDLEKGIVAAASTGLHGVRVALSGSAYDVDPLYLGRERGLLAFSSLVGGHLGARVDVTARKGLRVFGAWRSARQADNPYPPLCVRPVEGQGTDCVFVDDRALDLLWSGIDGDADLLGLPLVVRVRAHTQHHGEKTAHEGRAVAVQERAQDRSWRAGALADVRLALPELVFGSSLPALSTSLHGGVEVLRDRVSSSYGSRSRRVIDAEPPGQFLDDPARAFRVDGSTHDNAAFHAGLRSSWWFLTLDAGARVLGERVFAPGSARLEGPFVSVESLGVAFEVALLARVLDELEAFAALTRSERGETLAARTSGDERFLPSPAPALDDSDRFLEHGVELGARYSLSWLEASGVAYGAARTGELVPGVDPRDGEERLVRGPARAIAGVESRLRYSPAIDGLSGMATLGAALVDEGALFGGPRPAMKATPPFGVLVLDYRPSSSMIGAFARLRYAFPQARLSPEEELDPVLCPEREVEPQRAPCRGAAGFGLFDLGATVSPSERLRIDGIVENVLDSPWQLHGHPLPGGGIGARVTATLQL